LDLKILEYLQNNNLSSGWKMLPQYVRIASAEAGGRHLAALLGVIQEKYKNTRAAIMDTVNRLEARM
jgi:3,4-dihydroxyphenylacetate 2,3-dioxygenase